MDMQAVWVDATPEISIITVYYYILIILFKLTQLTVKDVVKDRQSSNSLISMLLHSSYRCLPAKLFDLLLGNLGSPCKFAALLHMIRYFSIINN